MPSSTLVKITYVYGDIFINIYNFLFIYIYIQMLIMCREAITHTLLLQV